MDPVNFYVRALADDLAITNIKTVAPWTTNSDGISSGDGALISDCFIMANDDAFKVKEKSEVA